MRFCEFDCKATFYIEQVAGRRLATFLSVESITSSTYCKLTGNTKVCKLCMTFRIQKDISCFYISTRKKETTLRKENFKEPINPYQRSLI